MKFRIISLLVALLTFVASYSAEAPAVFAVGDRSFTLNGEPFVIKAAELHYPRIPREYWEQRIQMCKALGMNTICLYVFWNVHETQPDVYDFSGQNDLAEFIRLCGKNGMYVILRPGPYVCAEWEMGGLPWWLLRQPDIRLRENDPRFLERVDRFQKEVAARVGGMTADKGGPVLMVQVENEYGSYGIDKEYVGAVRDIIRKYYGGDTVLFQCDWASNFLDNGLDDLLWTVNFGTGADIDSQFARLREVRPHSPLMCSEFWSGWFDKWGANHETRPAGAMVEGIDEMLSKGISFSLYMTHGGTNWGHWAGANSPGFAPDVTSYDYDAPVSESGQPTPKFHRLRETLAKYNGGEPLHPLPELTVPVEVKPFVLTEFAPLSENLPDPIADDEIHSMEHYGQGFGSILYSTTLPGIPAAARLTVADAHDFAQIFVDGSFIGTLDRRHGEKELVLPPVPAGARLDILVEAMGRINFGRAIKDFKGITDSVAVDGTRLKGWDVFSLPDEYGSYASMDFRRLSDAERRADGRLPRGAYRGSFHVDKPSDTFLNFESWGKGLVYVNGHPLGRIWEIGPQQTLYTPGCWLREGENEIMVFDILGPREARSEGLAEPVLDRLGSAGEDRFASMVVELPAESLVLDGSFGPGNGWQEKRFSAPVSGRYLCIEALDAHDGKDAAAIAELYVLDENGERISREQWTAAYADSEDTSANRTVEKTFDLQESTYWSSAPGRVFPHMIVIDLGARTTLGGLQYLPRMESETPGAVRNFRLYVVDRL